jgi:hypothetical protein
VTAFLIGIFAMRKTILLVLLASSCAFAQNLTTVTAANIQKAGAPLASGTLCFTATDANDTPIGFRIGGGGQEVVAPYCTAVSNGAIGSFQVANPANTSPENIQYRIEVFDQYTRVLKYAGVQFSGATFNLDNYVPSANLPLGASVNTLSVGNLTVTGSCSGCTLGGGYATLQNAAGSITQRVVLNWTADIVCADNAGQSRSDCALSALGTPGTYTKITTDAKGRVNAGSSARTTDLADFNAIAPSANGKIPIWDQPSQSYIPGDPLVQGVVADGSTTAANPVPIGGYDTAGTPALHRAIVLNAAPAGNEYAIITRPIPSGTQAVSGTVTANISGSISNTGFNVTNFPSGFNVNNAPAVKLEDASGNAVTSTTGALDVNLKSSGITQAVSGTITGNQGGAAALSSAWPVKVTDGSNTLPTMDAAARAGFVKITDGANTQPTGDSSARPIFTKTTDGSATQQVDPCQSAARSSANINLSASGRIVVGTTAKQTYICSMELITATAQNIALVEGTGTTCATGTAGLAGGTTAASGWNLAANGGFVKGVGGFWVFKTGTTGDDICLLLSGTGQTSGSVQWVQQ